MIKGHVIKVFLLGAKVAFDSEVAVLKIGTLHVSNINIRFSLVGPFMWYFRLWMEVNLATMIILSREVVSL